MRHLPFARFTTDSAFVVCRFRWKSLLVGRQPIWINFVGSFVASFVDPSVLTRSDMRACLSASTKFPTKLATKRTRWGTSPCRFSKPGGSSAESFVETRCPLHGEDGEESGFGYQHGLCFLDEFHLFCRTLSIFQWPSAAFGNMLRRHVGSVSAPQLNTRQKISACSSQIPFSSSNEA